MPVSPARACALLAVVSFCAALAWGGMRFAVYSHLQHPVAMLGASGVPGAAAFNAFAYVVPGALAAAAALLLRERLRGAPPAARIGAQALALAGLAFLLQGLWPLDSSDLHSRASALHGAAWTFWWVALGVAAALLVSGLRSRRSAAVCALAAAALVAALAAPAFMPAGLAQRIAFAAWFATVVLAAGLSRDATSMRGSSPTGPA